jgi:hypothetical protein
LKDTLLSDVLFRVGTDTIPAHRIILVSKNEKFRAMFTGQMRETISPEIEIEGVKANIFKVCSMYLRWTLKCIGDSMSSL